MIICENCGTENSDGFRFCGGCGSPLAKRTAPRQMRKIVTALFCDVTGSTALGEELDPEVLRTVINRYFAELRATIERHGGTVERFQGDAVMAVFGIPRVHEDDALRAVRAAAEIRERMPALADEVGVTLRFRTGVNTGPVLMGEGENLAVGDAVNVAARLEQAAAPGEILLGEDTLRLVRDAVQVEALDPLALKGKSEPVVAFRLLSVDATAPWLARHLDVPLVGRRRELAVLRQGWDRAVEESRCHLLTLLGEAGVGKSRLVAELLRDLEDQATILRGRCLHYGEGITFWPLVEALMPLGPRSEYVLSRVSEGGTATPEELFWEVRRLLESLAAERPVVLYLDDLHWAQPMLLDLLDHIADLSRGASILLLCSARAELLDARPGWGGGKLGATTLLLEPLGTDESEMLLDQLSDGLDPEARARVVAASDGNPLFLEEMVALVRDRGSVEAPPTIQALLSARLEQLAVEQRELLERGAIEGEVFHRLAVRELADQAARAQIDQRLAELVRSELIRPHRVTVADDEAFRFRHLLIRDAAYDALPKATRAELHERFANWLETSADLIELDEIAGWHLEQAVRYRQELGRAVDERLADRAAQHLYAAGTRAAARQDLPGARNLLERALALASSGGSLHSRIVLALAETLVDASDYAGADRLLLDAEADPDVAPYATLIRLEMLVQLHSEELAEKVRVVLPVAMAELERRGDQRELAKAHLVASWPHWMTCQFTTAATEFRIAAEHARAAGDEGLRIQALSRYVGALRFGRIPAAEMARELDTLEAEQPGPYLAARLDTCRASLATFAGRFEEARILMQRACAQMDALGYVVQRAGALVVLGQSELAAGDPSAARTVLLESDAILAEVGERAYRSTTQALLAAAYEQLGQQHAARAAIELAEGLTVEGDLATLMSTHSVRARLALAEDNLSEAEGWARSAVEVAERTDFIAFQGEARLDLATVLVAAGRREEADAEVRQALALFEAKGHEPYAAKARALLAAL